MRTLVHRPASFGAAAAAALSFVLALALLFVPAAGASALASAPTEPVPGVTVTELDDGSKQVDVDGETFIVESDKASNTITVTNPDGSQTIVDATPSNGFGGPQARGSIACTTIMWVVTTVHSAGWGGAIAIVAASGPTGAAILVIMYALGSNFFLSWAAGQC